MAEVGRSKVLFSKKVIDLDLLKYDNVKKLFEYVLNGDIDIDKVKTLVTKANRDLRFAGLYLYLRKSFDWDKDAENRICIIRRR